MNFASSNQNESGVIKVSFAPVLIQGIKQLGGRTQLMSNLSVSRSFGTGTYRAEHFARSDRQKIMSDARQLAR
jgi:hypothetical protein